MAIRFYNTATRQKEVFTPINSGKAGIYVCGVTVYDLCHIGHARSAIIFDVLVRYLRARGFDVTYVRNFTDVDDKIIKRANETGKKPDQLALEFIEAFHEDMGRLGVLNADIEPKATEHIDEMIGMISTLLDKGYAYSEGNDVFFAVEKFHDYGALSGRKLDEMQAGSRIAVNEKKKNPLDFALWKSAKPGEPSWPSPWGDGRPGWHIECSVMSNKYLGASFDIHGGGKDLLFPHHENERAQSLCSNGGSFARYWIHNGFVTVESEKMAKSIGNFITIRDALEVWHPEVLRLFLISKHYKTPLDFAKDPVLAMQSGLVRIYRTIQRIDKELGAIGKRPVTIQDSLKYVHALDQNNAQNGTFLEHFVSMMDDDLNSSGAIGLIFEKIRDMNKILDTASPEGLDKKSLEEDRRQLLLAGNILGLIQEDPAIFFNYVSDTDNTLDTAEIERLIEQRNTARKEKNWARADEIRDIFKKMGVVLEDGPKGTTWRLDV